MKNTRSLVLLALLLFISAPILLHSQVVPGDPKAVPVEFRFTYKLPATDSGVGINGTMNNWTAIYKMKQTEPNQWVGVLQLMPGTYQYKFVRYTDTTSQTGVTAYFTDPLNSRYGGPFNDSQMPVTDPMVYYFLPVEGSVTAETKPLIQARIAVSNSSQLDAEKIEFYIDGVQIPNAKNYYNAMTRSFEYMPELPLSYSEHVCRLKVYTTKGDSSSMTTQFKIVSDITTGPYTFYFDSKSPNFNFLSDITRVGIKSTFNFEGLDDMADPDSDGVYTFSRDLTIDKPEEYTYIINGGSYINDPDHPILSKRHRSEAIKKIFSYPRFTGFTAKSGQVFPSPLSSIVVRNYVVQSDSSYPIDKTRLSVRVDGKSGVIKFTEAGNGYEVYTTLSNPAVGRHWVTFNAKDDHGYLASPASFVFGVYPPNSGYHYVDTEDDDKGTGLYTYPAAMKAGSADIREIGITATPNKDSLLFSVKMESISDNTRLGFSIVNKLDRTYTDAPQDVELRVPTWNERGVYMILAKPGSAVVDTAVENKLLTEAEPLSGKIKLQIETAALANNEFRFRVALSDLEKIMGTYHDNWYYGMYSYFRNSNGTIEVGTSENGFNYTEDTDVYDVAFFSDPAVQARLLSNFMSEDMNGGPRIATIGSNERGYLGIAPGEIEADLALNPSVKILADGGEILIDKVKVYGQTSSGSAFPVKVHVNNKTYDAPLNGNNEFSAEVTLTEGENIITAELATKTGSVTSAPVIYKYVVDHKPVVKISATVNQNSVNLDASASADPDGKALSYKWTQDRTNPAQVSLGGANSPALSFQLPENKGEYYFRLKATDADGDTGWARSVVVRNDSGRTFVPDMATWKPRWQDSLVIYSIFVRTFDASGDFKGITARMGEIASLGVNCLWLLPIHPTTGNLGPDNPGYAITDYMNILENYGTKADFKAFVDEAHKYGIRVILDQVIQHTSDLHPFMKDANKYKEKSPYYPFYLWDSNNNFQYLLTWVDLPSINYESEVTRNYLLRMAKYWVQDFNIDGYRCDVAWAINQLRPSGPGYWQKWRTELKNIKPDVFLLAEADARTDTTIFNKKFDAAYDWQWFTRIKNVITNTGSINDLNEIVEYYLRPEYPKNGTTFKFLENQDEQRFIEAFGLGNTKVASAHLLTAPGLPQLYAGQEAGEETNRGNIDWSDPNGLRPYYKKLIEIRKNSPALYKGEFLRVNNTTPQQVYSYLRTTGKDNAVVALNFSSSAKEAFLNLPVEKLPVDTSDTYFMNDLLNNESFRVKGSDLKNFYVSIPASSARIFVIADTALTSIDDENTPVPVAYELMQNYPNPFNPSTAIRYTLPYASKVTISVFNILGQKVTDLVNNEQAPGLHEAYWNAYDVASGVYIYRIDARSTTGQGSYRSARKMILVK